MSRGKQKLEPGMGKIQKCILLEIWNWNNYNSCYLESALDCIVTTIEFWSQAVMEVVEVEQMS